MSVHMSWLAERVRLAAENVAAHPENHTLWPGKEAERKVARQVPRVSALQLRYTCQYI